MANKIKLGYMVPVRHIDGSSDPEIGRISAKRGRYYKVETKSGGVYLFDEKGKGERSGDFRSKFVVDWSEMKPPEQKTSGLHSFGDPDVVHGTARKDASIDKLADSIEARGGSRNQELANKIRDPYGLGRPLSAGDKAAIAAVKPRKLRKDKGVKKGPRPRKIPVRRSETLGKKARDWYKRAKKKMVSGVGVPFGPKPERLGTMQLAVLKYLKTHSEASYGKIAKALDIKVPRAATVVKSLVEAGKVTKTVRAEGNHYAVKE